jgi:hypothetical protein
MKSFLWLPILVHDGEPVSADGLHADRVLRQCKKSHMEKGNVPVCPGLPLILENHQNSVASPIPITWSHPDHPQVPISKYHSQVKFLPSMYLTMGTHSNQTQHTGALGHIQTISKSQKLLEDRLRPYPSHMSPWVCTHRSHWGHSDHIQVTVASTLTRRSQPSLGL